MGNIHESKITNVVQLGNDTLGVKGQVNFSDITAEQISPIVLEIAAASGMKPEEVKGLFDLSLEVTRTKNPVKI